MKVTHRCPKCSSDDIYRMQAPYGSGDSNKIVAGFFTSIAIPRYLCGACGYIEEWIDNPNDLAALRDRFPKASINEGPEGDDLK